MSADRSDVLFDHLRHVAGSCHRCRVRLESEAAVRSPARRDGRTKCGFEHLNWSADMEHVPLPQRPPKRRRHREGAAPAVRAPNDGASAAPVPNREKSPEPDWAPKTAVPTFVPDVKVVRWVPGKCEYEYKDHTADIQIHSWGDSVEECFAWAALAMYNYMTPLKRLAKMNAKGSATGARVPGNANMGSFCEDDDDVDEEADAPAAEPTVGHTFEVEAHDAHSLLFAFLDELLFNFHTTMTVCNAVQVMPIERGDTTWRVKGTGVGERFVDGVHEQGTEVKAITYSAMQIVERSEAEAEAAVADDSNPGARRRAELFVIVDI